MRREMKINTQFPNLLLVVIVTFVALSLMGCTQIEKSQPLPPISWKHCYSSFEKHVIEVAGVEAKDCGFFTIDAAEADKIAIKECLKDLVENNDSFRVGHLSYGDDSMLSMEILILS